MIATIWTGVSFFSLIGLSCTLSFFLHAGFFPRPLAEFDTSDPYWRLDYRESVEIHLESFLTMTACMTPIFLSQSVALAVFKGKRALKYFNRVVIAQLTSLAFMHAFFWAHVFGVLPQESWQSSDPRYGLYGGLTTAKWVYFVFLLWLVAINSIWFPDPRKPLSRPE